MRLTPREGSSPSLGTTKESWGLREPRQAARRAHHAEESGKIQSVYKYLKRNIAKISPEYRTGVKYFETNLDEIPKIDAYRH